jgi:hypothetical protein
MLHYLSDNPVVMTTENSLKKSGLLFAKSNGSLIEENNYSLLNSHIDFLAEKSQTHHHIFVNTPIVITNAHKFNHLSLTSIHIEPQVTY